MQLRENMLVSPTNNVTLHHKVKNSPNVNGKELMLKDGSNNDDGNGWNIAVPL